MMPIERTRPEDFDAVFRLLSQSFPAGKRRDAAGQLAAIPLYLCSAKLHRDGLKGENA